MKEQKKLFNKKAIITIAIGILSLSIGGFSIFNFNFNISMQEQQKTSIQEDITENISNGTTTAITEKRNEEHSQETTSGGNINLSFEDYIGKWKLHLDSYNGKELYSEIEINNVDETNRTINLTYHYSISPVLAGNNTIGQNSITVSYKNEKITVLYPDENEITDIRKEELEALTTDLFIFEDAELGKIRSCKLAIAEDRNLYANHTETGSYDYEMTLCTK